MAEELFRAACAASPKCDGVIGDRAVEILPDLRHGIYGRRKRDVLQCTTFCAHEVGVRDRAAVETIRMVLAGDLHDLSERGQQGQIPVDGTQADVRKICSNLLVDGVCRWVVVMG